MPIFQKRSLIHLLSMFGLIAMVSMSSDAQQERVKKSLDSQKGSIVNMLNSYGYGNVSLSRPLTRNQKNFFDWVRSRSEPVIADIGAGFGAWTKELLKCGASRVYSIELERRHLDYLFSHLQPHEISMRDKIVPLIARFPNDGKLSAIFLQNQFDAILSMYLFQFLTGKEIEKSFQLMFHSLTPNGKIGIWTGSLKRHWHIQKVREFYQQNEKANLRYPGECWKMSVFPNNMKTHLPGFYHFLTPDFLKRIAENQGFVVELAEYEGEDIALIARKSEPFPRRKF